nr:hypothetical protein [Tanacetum cinerariifolium]
SKVLAGLRQKDKVLLLIVILPVIKEKKGMAIDEDEKLVRAINGLCDGLTVVIKERENFMDKLGREFELRAFEKKHFIETLKGNADY